MSAPRNPSTPSAVSLPEVDYGEHRIDQNSVEVGRVVVVAVSAGTSVEHWFLYNTAVGNTGVYVYPGKNTSPVSLEFNYLSDASGFNPNAYRANLPSNAYIKATCVEQ